MSEKTFWKWLSEAMRDAYPELWRGVRLEGCNTGGVPDTMCKMHGKIILIEIKDWSLRPKHPLGVKQFNYLNDFGGFVAVKTFNSTFHMIHSSQDLSPLKIGDKKYVIEKGCSFDMKDFNHRFFAKYISSDDPGSCTP